MDDMISRCRAGKRWVGGCGGGSGMGYCAARVFWGCWMEGGDGEEEEEEERHLDSDRETGRD